MPIHLDKDWEAYIKISIKMVELGMHFFSSENVAITISSLKKNHNKKYQSLLTRIPWKDTIYLWILNASILLTISSLLESMTRSLMARNEWYGSVEFFILTEI